MQTEGGRPPPGLPTRSAPPDSGGKPHRPRSSSNGKRNNVSNNNAQERKDGRRHEPKEEKFVLGPPQKSFPSSQRQYGQSKNAPPGYANGHTNPPSNFRRGGPSEPTRRTPSSRGSRQDTTGRHVPSGPTSRPYPPGNPRGPRGPPREDRKKQSGGVWSSKGTSPSPTTEEPSTSPNSLSALLPEITPDMLVDSPLPGQESNFIDSLFAGIGLDDDEPSPSTSPLSASPPADVAPPPTAPKTETMEEWMLRKERESKAMGSWFNMEEADDPLESSRPVYRSRNFDYSDSKYSFGKKPEFLERRQEAKAAAAAARVPPGFASGPSTDEGDPAIYRPKKTAPPPGFSSSPSPSSPMNWFKGEGEGGWDKQRSRDGERDRERDRDRDRARERDREWDRDRRRRVYGEEGEAFSYEKPTTTPAPPPGFSRPVAPPPGLEEFGKQQEESSTKAEAGKGSSAQTTNVQEENNASTATSSGSADKLEEAKANENEKIVVEETTEEVQEPKSRQEDEEGQKDEEKVVAGENDSQASETSITKQNEETKSDEPLQQEPTTPTPNATSNSQPQQPEEQPTPTKSIDAAKEKSPKKANEASIRSKRRSLKSYLPAKGSTTPSPTKGTPPPVFPLPLSLPPLGALSPMGPAGMPGAPILYPVPFAMDQLPPHQKPPQQPQQSQHYNNFNMQPHQQPQHLQKQNKTHHSAEMHPPNLPFLFPSAGPSSLPPFGVPPAGPLLPTPMGGQAGPMHPPNIFPMGPYNFPVPPKNFGNNMPALHSGSPSGPMPTDLHNHHNHHAAEDEDGAVSRWFASPARSPATKPLPGDK